jgi:hypothetical protein
LRFFKGDFQVLKFLDKGFSLIAAVIVAGITPISTLAQSTTPTPVTPPATAPALLLIQGRVTRIQGNIVTVRTPDTTSTCPPNIPCLPTTFVGSTFNVDISSAVFQSATGSRVLTPTLIIGDSVVIAGRQGVTPPVVIPSPAAPPRLIIAEVVTKDVI